MIVYDIIVLVILAGIVGAIIYKLIKDRAKTGCSSSCGGCSGCPMAASCRGKDGNKEETGRKRIVHHS